MDDLAFVQRLSSADSEAVEAFETRFKGMLIHAFGRAVSKWRPERPVHADDYVQDFIGHLFSDQGRRLRTYSGRSRFSSWLYTVALRYFQRALSKLAHDRRGNSDLVDASDPNERSPEEQAIRSEELAHIRGVVHALPAEEQLLIQLFFVDGLNATEVARTLGSGTSAVRMRKKRILEKLRHTLLTQDGDSV